MSLKKSFAKVMNRIGGPVPSLEKELKTAIDADDAAEIESLFALSPSLITAQDPDAFGAGEGVETEMLAYALQMQKKKAAWALIKAVPALLTSTDSNGQDLMMRILRAPASREEVKIAVVFFKDRMAGATDKHGNTYLHIAAGSDNGDTATLEIISGYYNGRLDVANEARETPLMTAGRMGTVESAKYLLNLGADRAKTDSKGLNATMHAIRHSNLDVATFFMRNGGIADLDDESIDTQRRVATYEGKTDFLDALAWQENFQRERKERLHAMKEEANARVARENAEAIPAAMQRGSRSLKAPRTARFRGAPKA